MAFTSSAAKKTCANIRLERSQNLAVDVIEKIDTQEQKKCPARAAHSFFSQRIPSALADCSLPGAECKP